MNSKNNQSEFSEVSIQRINKNTIELCWQPKDGKPGISICDGLSRKEALRNIPADEINNGCVKISGLDPAVRYYYHLKDEAGNRLMTAERRILMEGSVNFRDIGGYKTSDGREVKWGKVFRADGLARLTESDHRLLTRMKIKHVFDFRTKAEISEAPDKLPEDGVINYLNLPVTHGKFDFVDAMRRLKKGDVSWLTPDFMVNGYIRNLEEFAGVWGEVINCLADLEGGSILFHCTGGKDRTGTCAALILLMLGVSEETITDDHQLSNIYIADLLPRIFKQIASYGVDPDVVAPYLTAPKECILAVLDHIRNKYGTASAYLANKAGVTISTQEALKEKLLM
jgi:protein-tyrosine phosphatase